MGFHRVARFVSSRQGRWLRIGLGTALLSAKPLAFTRGGRALRLFGAFPLLMGALDLCPLAPAFGLPLQGRRIRERLGLGDAPLFARNCGSRRAEMSMGANI